VGLANHSVLISRSGREYDIDDSAAPILGRDGQLLGAVLVFHDVTETRRLARQMRYDATHDALTGLVNAGIRAAPERALASAKQYGVKHTLCYLDLDRFSRSMMPPGMRPAMNCSNRSRDYDGGVSRPHTLARSGR